MMTTVNLEAGVLGLAKLASLRRGVRKAVGWEIRIFRSEVFMVKLLGVFPALMGNTQLKDAKVLYS